jgi:hypothetical protein
MIQEKEKKQEIKMGGCGSNITKGGIRISNMGPSKNGRNKI